MSQTVDREGHAHGPAVARAVSDADQSYDFNPNETFKEIVYREDWKQHRSQAYNDYRAAWDSVPRNKVSLDFPLHLDIETTNICNLKCPMCPRTVLVDHGEFSELGSMTREEYAAIIDEGVKHGVSSVKLNYLGEPLAHKDVVWQVAYAKQHGVVDVMMNSNASLLRKELSQQLLEAGLDALFVSFDAVSPDLYADQRVGTSIGKVIDNVYEFVRLRNEKYPQVHVRLSMVMYDDPIWMEQFQGLQLMWKHLVDAVGYGFYSERDANAQIEFPEVKGFWCAQPFQRMMLKYNGNVTICCSDDKDETVLGNWRDQGLHAIWNSDAYKEIRKLHAEGNYYKMAMCRKCLLPVSK
jgi:radical SAM protein with 4Fe4S-binding SPASM domain